MSTIPSPMPRDQRSIDNEHLKILMRETVKTQFQEHSIES
jgi:hypothetical protein